MSKDTIIATISDTHSGGSTALFPARQWEFENATVLPKDNQLRMFEHWTKCAEAIKRDRDKKDLVLVHDGDAIEGFHHNTAQVMTMLKNEQIEVHLDLMDTFMQAVGFGGNDKLYYVKGTEVHSTDAESIIAEDLGAEQHSVESWAFDELKLQVNGRWIWWIHRGPTAGKGANRGNALRIWLKNIFYDCLHEGKQPPDYVITGHVHDPDCGSYTGRMGGHYHKIRGMICPSWQQKTRYGHGAVPLKLNKIGMQYFIVTKDGLVSDPPEELLMD